MNTAGKADVDGMDRSRRALVTTLAGLSAGPSAAGGPRDPGAPAGRSTLVAYFSRSGNTRVLAGVIQRRLDADLFEILPATPYPEDYLATVAQAKRERDGGTEPPLANAGPDMKAYSLVYLGFPIWGETTPPLVRSFLSAHDWSGKTLIPFVTHGGYGLGSSHAVLDRMANAARRRRGFVMQADQERRTMEQVLDWLKQEA